MTYTILKNIRLGTKDGLIKLYRIGDKITQDETVADIKKLTVSGFAKADKVEEKVTDKKEPVEAQEVSEELVADDKPVAKKKAKKKSKKKSKKKVDA